MKNFIQNDAQTSQRLNIALLLWVGYFLIIGLVDWFFGNLNPQIFNYYAVLISVAFLVLLFALFPFNSSRIENSKLPVSMIILAIVPSLLVHLMAKFTTNGNLFSPEGMTMRITPVLLIGVLLVSRQYNLRAVIAFCLTPAIANIIGIWLPGRPPRSFSPPPPPPILSGYLVTFIQTISLLLVGYFVSQLITNLRKQGATLADANSKLKQQAITREELTISQERNRMARELHDTLAHTLTGLTVQLQAVAAYVEIDPQQSKLMVEDSLTSARDGLQATRRALKDLRAAPLEDLGLVLAIREFAISASERNPHLEANLNIHEPFPTLKPQINQCLYRIAQEAISNVDYHSSASNFTVSLSATDRVAKLAIADNGIGFDPSKISAGHWGIQGMHERAKLVDGELVIDSQPNAGTTISVTIPILSAKGQRKS